MNRSFFQEEKDEGHSLQRNWHRRIKQFGIENIVCKRVRLENYVGV